jgi:hypothetical protein
MDPRAIGRNKGDYIDCKQVALIRIAALVSLHQTRSP